MRNDITLKDWCEGKTPDCNDLVGWSNLIFQRSLQINEPLNDKVSQYFVVQWMQCAKETSLLASIFERTFSNYPVSTQIALTDRLVEQGQLKGVELLPQTRQYGPLQKYLLTKADVWDAMPDYLLRDYLHHSFESILRPEYPSSEEHAAWASIERIENSTSRAKVFSDILAPRLRASFGFLNADKKYFDTKLFHGMLSRLGTAWNVHPANFMYALLCLDPASTRSYDKYSEFIEPYANDIRALIQWSSLPRDERIRNRLPDCDKISTIDGIAALALSSGYGLAGLFQDMNRIVIAVEHDEQDVQALGSAFD